MIGHIETDVFLIVSPRDPEDGAPIANETYLIKNGRRYNLNELGDESSPWALRWDVLPGTPMFGKIFETYTDAFMAVIDNPDC